MNFDHKYKYVLWKIPDLVNRFGVMADCFEVTADRNSAELRHLLTDDAWWQAISEICSLVHG